MQTLDPLDELNYRIRINLISRVYHWVYYIYIHIYICLYNY